LLACDSLRAAIALRGKDEMVAQSEVIAIVDIQELISTDKTKLIVDLVATGHVSKALKGDAKGQITFRIPRIFPCGAFDVSTGRHLVFLKRNEKDEYVGMNWFMSYVYLGGKTAKWFDEQGAIVDTMTPEEIVRDTEKTIKAAPNKPSEAIRR
jgi:hypothetical protein